MGIRVRKVDDYYGIYDSIIGEFVNPEYLDIKKKDIIEYLKSKPFPVDKDYSEEDLIYDLTKSSGSFIVPTHNKETAQFVAEMISELL